LSTAPALVCSGRCKTCPQPTRTWDRTDAVRGTRHNFGYGVDDDMGDLLAEYGADD
jgi:hypothetical protein